MYHFGHEILNQFLRIKHIATQKISDMWREQATRNIIIVDNDPLDTYTR